MAGDPLGFLSDIGSAVGGLVNLGESNAKKQKALDIYQQVLSESQNNPLRSNYGNINVDPRYLNAENAALARLESAATSGGLTPADQARIQQAQDAVGSTARGLRGSISDSMAARGLSGSGADIAAQSQANQDAVDRLSKASTAVAGTAGDRALQEMEAAGNLGMGIGGQQFGQKAQIANAQDIMDTFNRQAYTGAADKYAGALTGSANADMQQGREIGGDWGQVASDIGTTAAGAYDKFGNPKKAGSDYGSPW